jgi:hypothetical protein
MLLASTPYYGAPFNLPATIQAEDFDRGGEGVAYHDTTAANLPGLYRPGEGVDIEVLTDPAGGGNQISFINAGEWLNYTVNAPTTGNYTFDFRMASLYGATFHVEVDGVNKSGPITWAPSGGWDTWTTFSKSGINMTAGVHVVKIAFDSATPNSIYFGKFNWFRINAPTPPPPPPPPPLPTVTIAATDPNASETGPDSGTFTISRSGDTSAALTVALGLGGTASNGTDYNAVSPSVTIPAGQASAAVVITPIDDQLVEGSETVVATIAANAAYTIGGASSATITIADNDVAPPPPPPGTPTPFSGTPIALPGQIEIENFDNGGEGAAYHDTTAQNEGGAYRQTGVDIEPAGDLGGGYDVGWTHAGEWVGFTTSVAAAGNYDLDVRAANLGSGGAFHVEVDGVNVTGTLAVPNTGAFQTYTDVTKSGIALSAGQHFVKLVMDGNSQYGFSGNFNWMKWTASVVTPPPPPPPPPPPGAGPFGGTPWPTGAAIEAENYDVGGEGSAYHDTTANNEGLAYRTGPNEGVDVEPTGDAGGGYDVGWTHAGEWINYTINVATAGKYDLAARVAAGGAGGNFHVEFAGVDKTGAMTIPNTGGWQSYQTITRQGIDLAAGTYVMRVVVDTNGPHGFAGNFNWFKLTPTSVGGGTGQQPDLQLRNYGDTAYSGVGVINTTGIAQVRGNDSAFLPIIWQARIVNTGSAPDHFVITGTPSDSPNWRVWYFDSQVQGNPQSGPPGGNDISAAITSTGWDTGVLQPGQFRDFRFEAGPSPLLPAGAQENITVTATSAGDPSKVDVIKAVGIDDTRRELAIRRRNYAQAGGEAGTYLLDVQNYGNVSDQYRITAPGSGPGYTVQYFDAYAGGNDITAAVTSANGYVTNPIGFHALQNLAVQITPTDGQVHAVTLTVRSVADGSVGDVVTISNAKPVDPPSFFPIGVFGMPTWAFDTWKQRGANTVVGFDSFGGINTMDEWTQAAVDRGLYMIREPRANIAADVTQQNLLAWMQPDEEDLPNRSYPPSVAQQNYNAWKAVDPSMPVWVNFDGSDIVGWQHDVPMSNYPLYLNATDWSSSGVYPMSGWLRPDDLDVSGRALDWLEKTSGGNPQFATIESSNQKGPWLPPNAPGVTPSQVRAEVWDSIIRGARGIVYFPQAFTPTFTYDNTAPDVAFEITKQNALITSIGAALESPLDPPTMGVNVAQPLEATWRVYNGKTYMIVLNLSGQAVANQQIALRSVNGTTASVQGEGRSVAVSSGVITDSFAADDVHVYVI